MPEALLRRVRPAAGRARSRTTPCYQPLKVATIFSYAANEEVGGILGEEGFETGDLDASSRDFLERAIADYNAMFGTSYDTSASEVRELLQGPRPRVKDREVDLVIVVNMFLTGFDATTLNTLWVDKNLRQHGLIQAFSRTNRILNSVKAYGNIVCFREPRGQRRRRARAVRQQGRRTASCCSSPTTSTTRRTRAWSPS